MELMTAVGVGVLVRPGAEDAQLFLPSPPMGDGGSCEPVVERGIVVNFPLGCVTERFATRETEERTGRSWRWRSRGEVSWEKESTALACLSEALSAELHVYSDQNIFKLSGSPFQMEHYLHLLA